MLNGFHGLKVGSWHTCPKLFTGSGKICVYIIFSSGNTFSYAHFTLLSPQLLKWYRDKVWLIKLLSYGTTILQNSTLICLGLKMKSIQRMWIIVLNLTLFIGSSNLKKLLLNLESMSTPEIMSKNSPDSYILLIKYKRTSKACLLKTMLWGWQVLPPF